MLSLTGIIDQDIGRDPETLVQLAAGVVMRTIVANLDFDDFESIHECVYACHSTFSVAVSNLLQANRRHLEGKQERGNRGDCIGAKCSDEAARGR